MTNELVKVSYQNDRTTVLGRDLHKALEVKSKYADWFKRMCEYGFVEGEDFVILQPPSLSLIEKEKAPEQRLPDTKIDHQLTLDMAKEIAMLQRTPKGKEVRKYFIEVEKQYQEQQALLTKDRITQALTIAGERSQAAVKFFGVEVGMARITALNIVEDELNVNLEAWKALLPPSEDYVIPAMIPTEIAALLKEEIKKPFSAQKVNQLLLKEGYQIKPCSTWLLTEKGKQYASVIPFNNLKTGHAGYQIKWKVTILDVLRELLKNN